ncbi:uncharacterized protein LOC142322930 [Lycorma delicatula]|uniref:uncharacterized protein LOC142322930 n=1 Tax=Lycorma delicatula TaxID=130591 RepID=UPI003F50DF09
MLSVWNYSRNLYLRLLCIIILLNQFYLKLIHSKCNYRDERLNLKFSNVIYSSEEQKIFSSPIFIGSNELHFKIKEFSTSFGQLNFFADSSIDFNVTDAENDELYSVIMMQQGSYVRLEPDGYVRLKWFVSNIPGKHLKMGKKYWTGITLTEFEPIKMRDTYEYNILWVYQQVDNYTLLEELIEERTKFVLQNYFDYLCSRPVVEIVFYQHKYIDFVLKEMHAGKKQLN